MAEVQKDYWNHEEPITIGAKGVSFRYYKNAGKLQIHTVFEKQDGTVDRKTVTIDQYSINKLKEII